MVTEDALSSRWQLQVAKQLCKIILSLLLGITFNYSGYYGFKIITFLKSEVISICREIICNPFAEQVHAPAF